MPCVLTANIPNVLEDMGGSVMNVRNDGKVGTLRSEAHGHEPVVYCIQGNTIDREITSGANGMGVLQEKSYTLNTTDRHAVATFASKSYSEFAENDKGSTLKASGGSDGGGRNHLS